MGIAYTYRARDSTGQLVRGRVEADGLPEAVARLRGQGLLVLEVAPDRDLALAIRSRSILGRRVKSGELAIFCRQFATMIAAGLPIVTALQVLARQSGSRALRQALEQAVADVEAGETLAVAFGRANVFARVMVHMVAAAEVGGILDSVMERLAIQLEKEEEVRQSIRSALMYPLVVSALAVLVVTFLIVFVVPRFVQFFSDVGGELPFATRALLFFSAVVRKGWWAFLSGILGGIIWVRWWVQTDQGGLFLDRLTLRLPVLGPLFSKYAIARFCRILSSLMGSGVPILQALAVAARAVGNRRLAGAILAAAESVRTGESLVPPLQRSGLFPPMVLEMVSVGEESGTLEPMLAKVADFFEAEVQRSAERLSAALEPLLIFFLAVVVGGVVVAMVAPVFDLWTMIG